MKKTLICMAVIGFLISCSSDDPITTDTDSEVTEEDTSDDTTESTDSSLPNIMLIIADDMGLDASPGYSIGSIKPNMPNLQNIINTGLLFNNVWAYPTCSPTRASIITGKYGFRTSVLEPGDELSTSEISLHKYLDTNTNSAYSSSVIGKWHLSNNNPSHPNDMGIDYYAGSLGGGLPSYSSWNLNINGQTETSTEYVTTKVTDLAIDWVDQQDKPWFLWLAYNAPHTPFHLPPDDLHSQGALPSDEASINANPLPYYMAMLEALDSEYGRLLSSMSQEEKDNTIFIFIGDNGSPNQVAQEYNSRRVKGSLYQGGINIPMVISGKDVSRANETEDALINSTDLFATIAAIAGVNVTEINDSKSFKDLLTDSSVSKREHTYSEVNDGTGGVNQAIRNVTHKYIKFSDGSEALYDLSDNPLENPNLLDVNQLPLSAANSAMKDELVAKLSEIQQ